MKLQRLFAVCVLVVGAAAGGAWGQVRQVEKPAEKGVGVALPKQGFAYAMLPRTGALAVLHAGTGGVTIYPKIAKGSVEDAKTIKLKGTPNDVAYKRVGEKGYLLVLCQGENTLYVLDEETLAEAGKMKMGMESAAYLIVPQSAGTSYVYYQTARRGDSEAMGVGRANLATMTDEGELAMGQGGRSGTRGMGIGNYVFTISANGLRIYAWVQMTSPSGMYVFEVDEAKKTIAQLSYRHQSASEFFPDPFNNYVATPRQLFKYDLTDGEKMTRYVRLFHPGKPLMFSIEEGVLETFSYNTQKSMGKATVPVISKELEYMEPEKGGRAMRPYGVQLFYDAKDDGVMVCGQTAVGFVPLAAMEIPEEPLLAAEVSGSTSAKVDQLMTLSVVPKDARTKVEIKSAPAGVKLGADNKLTWTPGTMDVGLATITLRLSGNGTEKLQEISVEVRRAMVALTFVPTDMKLSTDGKLIALLDQTGRTNRGVPDQENPSTRVALVETTKGTIVADRTFTFTARTFAMDANYIYLALADSDAFYVLARKDLSDVKRVFTKGRVSKMLAVSDSQLFVWCDGQGSGVTVYKTPDVTPIEQTAEANPNQIRAFETRDRASFPMMVGNQYYYQGVLFDADGKPRMLVAPEGYPYGLASNSPVSRVNYGYDQQTYFVPSKWGVQVEGTHLRRQAGPTVGQFQAQATIILPDYPVLLTLGSSLTARTGPSDARRTKFQLMRYDLTTATAQATIPISDEIQNFINNSYEGRSGVKLAAVPGLVVGQISDSLFMLPTKELGVEKFTAPVHFELEQKLMVLDATKPSTMTVEARGGKGAIEYGFSQVFEGIEIDKAKGVVTFDPVKLMPKVTESVYQQMLTMARNVGATAQGRNSNGMTGVLEKVQQQMAAKFTKLMGREPKGIPALVPIRVVANDAELQSATYDAVVFLEIPVEVISDRLKQVEEEARLQREKTLAAQRENAERLQAPVADPEIAALKARLAELEKRNLQLEAQVQVLKELAGPSTRPN